MNDRYDAEVIRASQDLSEISQGISDLVQAIKSVDNTLRALLSERAESTTPETEVPPTSTEYELRHDPVLHVRGGQPVRMSQLEPSLKKAVELSTEANTFYELYRDPGGRLRIVLDAQIMEQIHRLRSEGKL